MRKIKHSIVVIDQHPIIHLGIKKFLAAEDDLVVAAATSSLSKGLQRIEHQWVDLAIMEVQQIASNASEFIPRIKSNYPGLKILVYSMLEERRFAKSVAGFGADGFLMKTSPPAKLLEAIRCILAGEFYFPPNIVRCSRQKTEGRDAEVPSIVDSLSRREKDVFMLMADGLDSETIGTRLHISRNTVDVHRVNIKNKLEVSSYKEVYRLAFRYSP